jgi:hypothetical protein
MKDLAADLAIVPTPHELALIGAAQKECLGLLLA